MKMMLPFLAVFVLTAANPAAALCPDTMKITCNDPDALAHIFKEHCSKAKGKSEFVKYYCRHLIQTCQEASEKAVKAQGNICYALGEEEGEIVGFTEDKKPTNCYRAVFVNSGFGAVKLKAMYPVAESFCKG
jgi:hypothetical protein